MLTPEILLAAGYKPFTDHFSRHNLGDWYRGSFQKRVTDDVGTRYFISIVHGVMPEHGGNPTRLFFTPDAQFTRGDVTFDVKMHVRYHDLPAVEGFFEEMWTSMKIDYYEGGPNEARGYPQGAAPG